MGERPGDREWLTAAIALSRAAALLRAAGIEVVEIADLAGAVRAVNSHLLGQER